LSVTYTKPKLGKISRSSLKFEDPEITDGAVAETKGERWEEDDLPTRFRKHGRSSDGRTGIRERLKGKTRRPKLDENRCRHGDE
jgi:hypothetical protein